jgi:hypothetical protein
MQSTVSLVVYEVFFSRDKQGIAITIELGNEAPHSMQLLEWTLDIPTEENLTLSGGPGPPSFWAGARWLERPPLVLDAQSGTGRVAVFFQAPQHWREGLPVEPLQVVLRGRVFPSSFLEVVLEVYSLAALAQWSRDQDRPIAARASAALGPLSTATHSAREVFSLHGIRTRGTWQKEIVPILSRAGFHPVPLDYGYFMALQLAFFLSRRKQVDWFRDEYVRQCSRVHCERPSIIAHSFGTYLIAAAIEKYPQIHFDRIILTGSIIRPEFPWEEFISRGQVGAILNQHGGHDIWVRIVEWFVADAGPSGGRGFDSDVGIIQQNHPGFNHGDYFYDLNYISNWIPFLGGSEPGLAPVKPPKRLPNWRYRFTVLSCILVVAIAGYGLLPRHLPTLGRPHPVEDFAKGPQQTDGRGTGNVSPPREATTPKNFAKAPDGTNPGSIVRKNEGSTLLSEPTRPSGTISQCRGYENVTSQSVESLGCAQPLPRGAARWDYSQFGQNLHLADGDGCLEIVRYNQPEAAGQRLVEVAVLWSLQGGKWSCVDVKNPAPPRTP